MSRVVKIKRVNKGFLLSKLQSNLQADNKILLSIKVRTIFVLIDLTDDNILH